MISVASSLAVAARLQVHDDLSEVRSAERRRRAAADRRDQPLDVGILPDDGGDRVLIFDQLVG